MQRKLKEEKKDPHARTLYWWLLGAIAFTLFWTTGTDNIYIVNVYEPNLSHFIPLNLRFVMGELSMGHIKTFIANLVNIPWILPMKRCILCEFVYYHSKFTVESDEWSKLYTASPNSAVY